VLGFKPAVSRAAEGIYYSMGKSSLQRMKIVLPATATIVNITLKILRNFEEYFF